MNVIKKCKSSLLKRYVVPDYIICARCNRKFTRRGLPRHLVNCLKNIKKTKRCESCDKLFTNRNYEKHICISVIG